MRLGMTENIDWAYIGALLANESDIEQVTFFKAFLKECSSWGTQYQVQSQLASVNLKLTKEEREQFEMLSCKDE